MSDAQWKLCLGVACLLVIGLILVAGLWPFSSHPKNEVSWLDGEAGLRFGDYATVLSQREFLPQDFGGAYSCSIEIWFQPGETIDSNTFIAFYTKRNPLQFTMHQTGDSIYVDRQSLDPTSRWRTAQIALDHVVRKDRKMLITVTSDGSAAAVYLDGVRMQSFASFGLTAQDFAGELVIANSAIMNNSWAGVIRGLAIYGRGLNAAQVARHYEDWTRNGQLESDESQGLAALYLFRDGAGTVIHNEVKSSPSLYIPDHYMILDQPLLVAPWNEYEPNWPYWKDVLVNIAGFIPLGCFVCAYCSSATQIGRPVLVTIIFGAALSFLIEALQSRIPSRDSSMTDVLTDTAGTLLGALICMFGRAQKVLPRVKHTISRFG